MCRHGIIGPTPIQFAIAVGFGAYEMYREEAWPEGHEIGNPLSFSAKLSTPPGQLS